MVTPRKRAASPFLLDRFLHHSEIIRITGKSYRLRHQSKLADEEHGTKRNGSKPAKAPTGVSTDVDDPKPAKAPTGSGSPVGAPDDE